MNYGRFRERVLKLIDRYSVAGTAIPSSYNNQQDDLNRIASLANDAMMEIAVTARPIPATVDLGALEAEDRGGQLRYTLPDDFFRFKTGESFLRGADGTFHTNAYLLQGGKHLLIPKAALAGGEHFELSYYRYPVPLPEKPEDGTELDNAPETHDAAAFYVAAFLSLHEDAFVFSSLYNKFEDKLAKLGPGRSAEVFDLSGADGGAGNYGVYEV